jgi:hypothetical protein
VIRKHLKLKNLYKIKEFLKKKIKEVIYRLSVKNRL